MNPLRWLALQVAVASLLLLAAIGLLWSSASAASVGAGLEQPVPPINDALQMLVPTDTMRTPAVVPTDSTTISGTGVVSGGEVVSGSAGITATGTATYYVVVRGDT